MNKKFLHGFWILSILLALSFQTTSVQSAPRYAISPYDLIDLINGWRTGNGYPALEIDPILMTTAYDTAAYMAVNGMRSHIGNVSGRIQAYGYGGGATVFATENFAIGPMPLSTIAEWWMDEAHQYPATNPNYVHIGAGVFPYGDREWYVVHVAYTSGSVQYTPGSPQSTPMENLPTKPPSVPQLIVPVQVMTPDSTGKVIHEVLPGQALWSIAIAYDTKIDELVRLNNLNRTDPTIYIGQKLVIFDGKTTATPTKMTPTPDPSLPTPTPSVSPTPSPTITKTPTTRPTRVFYTRTPTATPTQISEIHKSAIGLFGNKTIGVILISMLSMGILLILGGSFTGKPQAPPPQSPHEENQ
jgi:LysM repeat protein